MRQKAVQKGGKVPSAVLMATTFAPHSKVSMMAPTVPLAPRGRSAAGRLFTKGLPESVRGARESRVALGRG